MSRKLAAKKKAREILWLKGDLSYYLRKDKQTTVYKFIKRWKRLNKNKMGPIVIDTHRRMGKSTLLVILAIERALSRPGQLIKFVAPTYDMCRNIITTIIESILLDCPSNIKWRKVRNTWTFTNPAWKEKGRPSEIAIYGTDKDTAGKLRGQQADLLIIDEAGLIEDLENIINSVIAYLFVGKKEPTLIISSTPPEDTNHPFDTYCVPHAIDNRSYIKVPCNRNKDWTQEDEDLILSVCGSKDSVWYRREALCERINDERVLYIPEFQAKRLAKRYNILVNNHPRPLCYFPIEGIDLGYNHFTGVIFGYPDFQKQVGVVEDEIFVRKTTTGALAELIKAKEKELWGEHPYHDPRRFVDCKMAQAIADLTRDHGLYASPCDTFDRESVVSQLRLAIQNEKIRISPKCVYLLMSLESCVRDKSGKKIKFTEKTGHGDLIDALLYWFRSLPWYSNPFPPNTIMIGNQKYLAPGEKKPIVSNRSNVVWRSYNSVKQNKERLNNENK